MVNKRLLGEVKIQEEKFAKAFHSSPYAITLTRLSDGQIIEVNDSFLNIAGYRYEEVAGKTTVDLHLWDKEEDRVAAVEELSKSGKVQGREFQYRKKSGEKITGLFSAEIIPIHNQEFVLSSISDITKRKRAEEALRKAHDGLEMRVQERTSELSEAVERLRVENVQRQRLEDILRESENQVRFFASQCLTAQETERKRVADELHDGIAASLGTMRVRMDKITEEMKQGHGNPESLQDLASKMTEINNEVRRIMADLRPSILDDLGVIAAMNWFCREYEKAYSHLSVEKQFGISEPEVPDSMKTPIFRISQEAMNNIAKHSKASLVNLSLRREDDKVLLTIQDNGQSFDLDTARKGLGLSTMKERARLSGGSFDLESAPGKGARIRVSWPLLFSRQ
jgi:PAS domain S-box-containing protein